MGTTSGLPKKPTGLNTNTGTLASVVENVKKVLNSR
jgi:hypothetical protein